MVLAALASSLRWVARGLLTGLAVLALTLGAGVPATAGPPPAAQPASAAAAAPATAAEPAAVAVESPAAATGSRAAAGSTAGLSAEFAVSATATGTTDASVEHQAPLATHGAFHCGHSSDLSIQHRPAAPWVPASSRAGSALGQRAPPRD